MGDIVYKIIDSAALAIAEADGVLEPSADDRRDGFIHLSTAAQLEGTVERHFVGHDRLMLLALDASALGDDLRYETSRGGEAFPHFYGELPLAAMRWSEPLTMAPDGHHPLNPAVLEKIGGTE